MIAERTSGGRTQVACNGNADEQVEITVTISDNSKQWYSSIDLNLPNAIVDGGLSPYYPMESSTDRCHQHHLTRLDTALLSLISHHRQPYHNTPPVGLLLR